ncbi:MAG: hypothetical protein EBT09_08460 [Actinobacteria bacterium]|nr:hypothetical protein [Actinomycetota bacterium]
MNTSHTAQACISILRKPVRFGTGTVGGDRALWWTLAPVAEDDRWRVLIRIAPQCILLDGACLERKDADAFLAMNIDIATEVW